MIWSGFGLQAFVRIKYNAFKNRNNEVDQCFSWLASFGWYIYFAIYTFIIIMILIEMCSSGTRIIERNMRANEMKELYLEFLQKSEQVDEENKRGLTQRNTRKHKIV